MTLDSRVQVDGCDTRVWRLRAAALLVLLGAVWYVPWMLHSINEHAVWLSWPFVGASLLLVATTVLSGLNNWHRSSPLDLRVPVGAEPLVAVIVPTAGEPPEMLRRTLVSVLSQDWPHAQLCLAVGDDAGNDAVRGLVEELAATYPTASLFYYRPPARGTDLRRGDAKAGNLNAGLAELDARTVPAMLIETRDADDEVGEPSFLRRCVAQLQADPGTAYVQTIKESAVSPSDPFGNTDAMFYRGSMLARDAANAVFPCGSGLVWARAALDDIGGFPTWNLVEDLQSGVEALRRGWRGRFVPVVGAVGQTAPEDVQNVFKQRGTWALDTVRLLVWGDLRGLSLRQRLQFLELGMFYLQSVATLIFFTAPALGLLLNRYPLVSTQASYALHFWPVTVAIELFLLALNGSAKWEDLFRARQMWAGLAPVYAKSVVRAVAFGPHRKPSYKVTRKSHEFRWYWRETLPHTVIVGVLCLAVTKALLTRPLLTSLDLGSLYWAVIAVVFLGSFVPKGWHGVRLPILPWAAGVRATVSSVATRPQGGLRWVAPAYYWLRPARSDGGSGTGGRRLAKAAAALGLGAAVVVGLTVVSASAGRGVSAAPNRSPATLPARHAVLLTPTTPSTGNRPSQPRARGGRRVPVPLPLLSPSPLIGVPFR